MKFSIVAIFNRSVTLEMETDAIYEMGNEYSVYLDEAFRLASDKNVISLSGLQPDREYTVSVRGCGREHRRSFRTNKESVLLNVKSFGALGDKTSSDTAAIQAAFSVCPAGGTVYFPKGTYLSGPLFLKSHITLYLEEGALLLGEADRKRYPVLPGMVPSTDELGEYDFSSWEGNPLDTYASLITGMDCSHVDIIGGGSIDGNAGEGDWWENHKIKRGSWRPKTVFLCRCRNVRIQNITIQNSPSWTLHPYYCDDLEFLNLTVRNPDDSPNTDGIDPESCRNVRILGCRISVGDDCIAIKSGKYYMSLYHHKPSENILVRNCLLERGHGSVTVGSEAAGGVYNVLVERCVFDGTDRGLRIKTRRGRGQRSVLDEIRFTDIAMRNVPMPFTVNMFYFCDPDGHSLRVQDQNPRAVDVSTPRIGKIEARRISCCGVRICLACFYGLPEMPVEEIKLCDIHAEFSLQEEVTPLCPIMMDDFPAMLRKSIFAKNVARLELENITVIGSADEEPELLEVGDIRMDEVKYEG